MLMIPQKYETNKINCHSLSSLIFFIPNRDFRNFKICRNFEEVGGGGNKVKEEVIFL